MTNKIEKDMNKHQNEFQENSNKELNKIKKIMKNSITI
jgi:hypothetical protein